MTLEQALIILGAASAAAALYLLGDRDPGNYLDRPFPSWRGGFFKEAIAFLLYVFAGAFFVVALAEPSTVRQAVIAGLGWPALTGVTRRRAHA